MANTNTAKLFYKDTIPKDWTAPKFGDTFSFLKSFSFSREQLVAENTRDGIHNLHYGDIHTTYDNEILDFELEKAIPFLKDGLLNVENFEDDDFPALKDGDLIIADASEDYEGVCECVELKNLNGRRAVSGLHTFAVRAGKEKVALGFRSYVLKHKEVRRELRRIATGISVYGVSKTNLAKLKLPLPPLPEQKAIGEVLGLMDTAINKSNQLITQKELRKKWLMQNLLTGKKRLRGYEDEKWQKKSLKDILIPVTRPVEKPKKLFLALGIRSHGKGTFLKHEFDPQKIAMEILYVVKENDLIVNITFAWEGAIAIVKKEDDGALVSHRFPTFTFNSNNGVTDYFRHVIVQPRFKYLLGLISPGGAGRNRVLNKKDFLKLELKIPSVNEQKAIARLLQAADKEIVLLKTKTEKLKEQKKGLMQVLLTGKKRLKVN